MKKNRTELLASYDKDIQWDASKVNQIIKNKKRFIDNPSKRNRFNRELEECIQGIESNLRLNGKNYTSKQKRQWKGIINDAKRALLY
ncbi:MAG: hypothetical protein FWC41_00455 [Firmicutes bacterium]|nr:hypothetical protein [Bacillota bacterium]